MIAKVIKPITLRVESLGRSKSGPSVYCWTESVHA
jgi:hypothetical protein